MRQLFGEEGHLQGRHAAEVVDQHRHAVVTRFCLQRLDEGVDEGFAVVGVDDAGPWLAVDAEAQLDLAALDAVLLLFAAARQVADFHRQPEAPDAVAGLLGYRSHLAEGFTLLGGVACNLMHQRRAGDAARLLVIR